MQIHSTLTELGLSQLHSKSSQKHRWEMPWQFKWMISRFKIIFFVWIVELCTVFYRGFGRKNRKQCKKFYKILKCNMYGLLPTFLGQNTLQQIPGNEDTLRVNKGSKVNPPRDQPQILNLDMFKERNKNDPVPTLMYALTGALSVLSTFCSFLFV